MEYDVIDSETQTALQELLGYLNFSSGSASSGATNEKFFAHLNTLYRQLESPRSDGATWQESSETWRNVGQLLDQELTRLKDQSSAFGNARQAEGALAATFEHLLPAYLTHHADLLFHQSSAALFRPFFLGRAIELVVSQGGPWDRPRDVAAAALVRLNDFIGYRPVAVLETDQKIEPYEHEWLRPVPLYVDGVGVGVGRYREIIAQALDILRATDPAVLRDAWYDPAALEELAFDPRSYDFDHPANKRPNHQFGQWDPHHIDNQGRYRRFVVQQLVLDALLERVEQTELPHDEAVFEAAAALAGTMLMSSGTSGDRPEAHDSSVTLATLLPHIAAYRDEFYVQLIGQVKGEHGRRLREEAQQRRQPFGGVRQDLNHHMARYRASQLQHVHLAQIFAQMGYLDAADQEAGVVPTASARFLCEIGCRLTSAHLALDRGSISAATDDLSRIETMLHRGVECGALVDPWNILGFDAHFSLFPALENSIHDFRIDQLLEIVERTLGLYSQIWAEAATQNDSASQESLESQFSKFANWWDRFATTTVSDVEGIDAAEALNSARSVAEALRAWHQGGAAVGDVAFWRKHVPHFDSPKAFGQVVEALLDKHDFVGSMALLMQWLSQVDDLSLEEGDYSFHLLAQRWMVEVLSTDDDAQTISIERWNQALKFFDYLEANADQFWEVPRLDFGDATDDKLSDQSTEHELSTGGDDVEDDDVEDDEEDDELFSAAYDNVVFRDSAADGFDGEIMDNSTTAPDYELEAESQRLAGRLALLHTVAGFWKRIAVGFGRVDTNGRVVEAPDRWLAQARSNRSQLLRLLQQVQRHHIPKPSGSYESLVEFDRRRMIKDALLDQIVETTVETSVACWYLAGASQPSDSHQTAEPTDLGDYWLPDDRGEALYRSLLAADADALYDVWPEFIGSLEAYPLLYLPLARGGNPNRIVAARTLQQLFRDLLAWMPRLGLLEESCRLIEAAQAMERSHPVEPGAVTEFDHLFEHGYQALVEGLVTASERWSVGDKKRSEDDSPDDALARRDQLLVECLQDMTKPLRQRWLEHSRTLRLSILETVADEKQWQPLVDFIRRYGADFFTQRFMNFGNLRAILHQGVDNWLEHLQEDPDDEYARALLLEELDVKIPRAEAIKHLELILEAIVEHYDQYRDYNSTTTQSDRGDMLYTMLDFLRLLVGYDRIAWDLRPAIMAHEILVRRGRPHAAELWRRALAERVADVADDFAQRLTDLNAKHGMRLPTVEDRIAERFVQPLAIDRLRALVQRAVDESSDGQSDSQPCEAFVALQRDIADFTERPSGAGLDIPPWLEQLEEEVDSVHTPGDRNIAPQPPEPRLPETQLTAEQVQEQIDAWQADEE